MPAIPVPVPVAPADGIPSVGLPSELSPKFELATVVDPNVLVPPSVNGLRPIVLGSSVVAVPNELVPNELVPRVEEAVAV